MRLAAGFILMAFSLAALAAPKAEPWERWAKNTQSKNVIAHDEWNAFLSTYVKPGRDGVNRVAYGAVSAADRKSLAAYLARLQALPISKFSRAEQRGYWINVDNANTLNVVLEQ